jgi:pyruvate/2-oxoglutarate dehydrogenase complex dihydrolipoamide dehydrogenase (E3) component
VPLIERHEMGGDCLNVGCVPSKGVIAAARQWSAARRAAQDFSGPRAAGDGDFGAVMDRMRRLRADIAPIDGAERFRGLGVDVSFGSASFTGPDEITVGAQRLRFRRAVIATGARASAPAIPGLSDVPFLTNETLFDLTERPTHLIVLGGGPVGCEMAQAFAQLGTPVTLIERGERLLPRDDADAAAVVAHALTRDGVTLAMRSAVARIESVGSGVSVHLESSGQARVRSQAVICWSRWDAPNVEGCTSTARASHSRRLASRLMIAFERTTSVCW